MTAAVHAATSLRAPRRQRRRRHRRGAGASRCARRPPSSIALPAPEPSRPTGCASSPRGVRCAATRHSRCRCRRWRRCWRAWRPRRGRCCRRRCASTSSSHAVEGLAPGAYRYEPRAARAGAAPRACRLRAGRARAAALDQDVIGDAAAVFVLAIDRAGVRRRPARRRRAATGTRFSKPGWSASASTSRPRRAASAPARSAPSTTTRRPRWWAWTRRANGSCTSPRSA